jgi:hypothetical protein
MVSFRASEREGEGRVWELRGSRLTSRASLSVRAAPTSDEERTDGQLVVQPISAEQSLT